MPEYPRSPFEKTGMSITPKIDSNALDATVIGGNTPAAGSFTTVNTDVLAFGNGDTFFYEKSDNVVYIKLSDVDSFALWLDTLSGSVSGSGAILNEESTPTNPSVVPNYNNKGTGLGYLADNGLSFIVNSTEGLRITKDTSITVDVTDQLQGNILNNQMVSKSTFDILGLMTDPRFLNLQCEDPGAGTMTDASGQGNDGTYQGSMTTGDRVKKGMGWAIDFDNSNDYVDLGDADDFSFGDGTDDEAVTFFGAIEVVASASVEMVASKWDETTGSQVREWQVQISGDETLLLFLYDESANVLCSRITDSGLSVGWHSYAITYDGAGGANAANTIKMYIDGALVASTATNDASYVAMENLSSSCLIGAKKATSGSPSSFINGDIAINGIDGAEWSAMDVHRFHQLCKGLYGL